MPASLTDILAVLQNGVAAINNLRSQLPIFPLGTGDGGTALTAATDTTTTFISRTLGYGINGSVNNSSTGPGVFVNHTPSVTVPANFIVSGRMIRATALFRMTTSSGPPAFYTRMRLGGIDVAQAGPTTPAVSFTDLTHAQMFDLVGLTAPSSSANTESAVQGHTNAFVSTTVLNSITQPVALATNGALTLDVGSQWASSGSGTNTATLQALIVEALN